MIIACDVDGVIADINTEWLRRYNFDYDDNVQYDEITAWKMDKFVKPECGKKIFEYLHAPDFYDNVVPYPGALEGLWALREFGHEIVFVTYCVGPKMAAAKIQWMLDHNVIPSPSHVGMNDVILAKRKDMIRADMLIDDYDKNLEGFEGRKLLFDQPWNRHDYELARVKGWGDVVRYVERVIS